MYVCNVHGRWDTPGEDRKGMEWARGFIRDTAPHATGGVYVNFLTDDESDRVKAAYGTNYHRLAEIKKKYDPQNLFRINQNIRPDIGRAA
jgi:FAD/FMN-containing dehydrogenase